MPNTDLKKSVLCVCSQVAHHPIGENSHSMFSNMVTNTKRGIVQPTDEEMIAIEMLVCYSQFPSRGACHSMGMGVHRRKHCGCSGSRKGREQWARDFIVTSMSRNW